MLMFQPHLTHDSRFRAKQIAAKPSDRSAAAKPMNPLVAESSNRLASLFARAQMELRQLKTIASRAAVLNRNADPSAVEMHAAIDQHMMKGSQRRLRSLFRSADLEIQRMQKVASRSSDTEGSDSGRIQNDDDATKDDATQENENREEENNDDANDENGNKNDENENGQEDENPPEKDANEDNGTGYDTSRHNNDE